MAWAVLICVLAYQSHPTVGSVPRFLLLIMLLRTGQQLYQLKYSTMKENGNNQVKVILFIICLGISSAVAIYDKTSILMEVFLFLSAALWWVSRFGNRKGLFFYAPYILFTLGMTLVIIFMLRAGDKDSLTTISTLVPIMSIIEIIAFLIEYFSMPKCSHCKKRLRMKLMNQADFATYDYTGTKSYDIKSNSGEKIGEYDAPVSRTAYTFTSKYLCGYCGKITSRRESA
jgi:hypothetical protein